MENKFNELIRSKHNYLDVIKCDITPNTKPFKCAVSNCKNNFRDIKNHKSASFKFHAFPVNSVYSVKWKTACGLPLDANTKNLKICSDHFSLEDYDRNLKDEFLNRNFKRSLKHNAVPITNSLHSLLSVEARCSDTPSEDKDNEHKTDTLRESRKELLVQIDLARSKILEKRNSVKNKRTWINRLSKELRQVEKRNFRKEQKFLRTIFSDAQIKLLLGHKKVFWTDDDLASAFSLRHAGGKDFYLYLKNNLNYPLPSLSCVQAWAGN